MSYHYGFFLTHNNNLFHSTQGCGLFSTTSTCSYKQDGKIKGMGVYIHDNNLKNTIALFCTRTLIKNNWTNSNDVYMGMVNYV